MDKDYKIDQNSNWNKLSKEAQTRIRNEYKIVTTNTPIDGFPLFESIHLLEETYGKHNLIPKKIETWFDVENENHLTDIDINFINLEFSNKKNLIVKDSATALIQILYLIDKGYEGIPSKMDRENTNKELYYIMYNKGENDFYPFLDYNFIHCPICFYTYEQADKFIKNNRWLLKKYFMIDE